MYDKLYFLRDTLRPIDISDLWRSRLDNWYEASITVVYDPIRMSRVVVIVVVAGRPRIS